MMKIAILGASGCVGRTLVARLQNNPAYEVVASYQNDVELLKLSKKEGVLWEKVNLFDEANAQKFLQKAEVLLYLIHSLPVKNFEALDPELARSAARAAKAAGVQKIIYLSGIIPRGEELSRHLSSREATGKALASFGVPVIEVRASILLGTCSVSYQIVYHLAKRFLFLIGPRSLNSLCAPIALEDAAEMLEALLSRTANAEHEIFEIGSENIRYRDLVTRCGAALHGWKNRIISVSFFPVFLSALWVQLISGISHRVVAALMESLKDDTIPLKNRFSEVTGRAPRPLDEVLKTLAQDMAKNA